MSSVSSSDVSKLNDWTPSRTLPVPTTNFSKADAGVKLQTTGKLVGNSSSNPNCNSNTYTNPNKNPQNPNVRNGPSLRDYITDQHYSDFPQSQSKTGQLNLAGSPTMPPISRQRVHYPKSKQLITDNYDGSTPWVPGGAASSAGGPDAPVGKRSNSKSNSRSNPIIAPDTPRSRSLMSGTAQKLTGGGAPSSPAPASSLSPAHTRLYTDPSPPPYSNNNNNNNNNSSQKLKFNACRQVMDVLEKHDVKLKKTFYHTDVEDSKNIVVRTNHTYTELTKVLQDLGAKVDETAVRTAFQTDRNVENVTFSQVTAKATDTVYPGAAMADKDFFKPLPREGKRIGNGPGARHNTFRNNFLDHDMTPSTRNDRSYVERHMDGVQSHNNNNYYNNNNNNNSPQPQQQQQPQYHHQHDDVPLSRWSNKAVER